MMTAATLTRKRNNILSGNSPAKDFGQRSGNRCHHGGGKHGKGNPAGSVPIGGFRQAKPRGYAKMSHVVLQNNEHDGTQGNHPQQGIAEPRTCGNIGSPIARINKTNRNQQPGTNVFQYFQSAKSRT